MASTLKILLVEDNAADASLLQEYLGEHNAVAFELVRAGRLAEALALMGEQAFDVMLLDLSLPDSQGLDTVVNALGKNAPPIVVLTGLDDEQIGVQALKHGAQDYLVKGQINGRTLARSLRYAVHRHQMELERREHLRQLSHANETLLMVNALAQEYLSGQPLEEGMKHIIHTARMLVGAGTGAFAIYDATDTVMKWVYDAGNVACHASPWDLVGACLPGFTARYGRGIVLNNDMPAAQLPDGHMPLKNVLSIGVAVGDGWLNLLLANKEGGFNQDDAEKCQVLGHMAAAIVDRARLDESERQARLEAERARDELERRVRERTAELSETVDALEAEVRQRLVAEEALRSSGELLENIFSNLHVLTAYMDTDFNFVRVNRSYAEADGRTPEFFVGKNHFDLYPHTENELIFRQVVETGEPYFVYEKCFTYSAAPDRGETYWDWSLVPVKDQDGKVTGIVLSLIDVTRRVLAQEEARESDRRFRAIFSQSFEYIVLLGPDGKVLEVNQSALDFAGVVREEVIGRKIWDTSWAGRDHALAIGLREVVGAAAMGKLFRQETELATGDGRTSIVDVSIKPVLDDSGKAMLLIVEGRDITDQRHMEEAIMRLANIVQSSDDAIIGENLDGKINSWNRGAERLFGYSADEVLGKPVDILVPDDRESEVRHILQSIRGGRSVDHFETVRVTKDGAQFQVTLAVSPIRDREAKIVGGSSIMRDITERKRLEREILEISGREQRRIGQDLHDVLGQNLTGVAFLSKVLQQKLAARQVPEAVDAAKIARLVNESIGHARALARGLRPVELKSDGLMTALKDFANNTERLFGIRCTFDYDQPLLMHDNSAATHLYHIVQEAVTNAIKHGRADEIRINFAGGQREHLLTVCDNGTGIPDTFDPEKGMGLRIMKYRASMIEAALSVAPNPAGGTTVSCCIAGRNVRRIEPK